VVRLERNAARLNGDQGTRRPDAQREAHGDSQTGDAMNQLDVMQAFLSDLCGLSSRPLRLKFVFCSEGEERLSRL